MYAGEKYISKHTGCGGGCYETHPCRKDDFMLHLHTAPQERSCPDGGIGRRAGLKHQWPQGRAGSTPAPGTSTKALDNQELLFYELIYMCLYCAEYKTFI